MLGELERERRAIEVRVAGEQRWINGADAGLYRDALGVVPPGGLPDAFLEPVDGALSALIRRYAATHGPFTTSDASTRFGVDVGASLAWLEDHDELIQGELRPGGSGREWCHPDVLRRIRRASLAVLRKEVEPVDARQLARFLPRWQGIDAHQPAGAGVDRLRDVLVALQGVAVPAETWEKELLPRRVGAYSQAWLDQLCAAGEVVWVGAGALGRSGGRVALYFRDDLALLGPPGVKAPEHVEPAHAAIRERLSAGACFYSDLLVGLTLPGAELQDALWDLVWGGEVTNDAFAPLRAGRLTLAVPPAARGLAGGPRRSFSSRRRTGAAAQVQGRWSLTAPLFAAAVDPSARRRALGELLLERYGVLTREQVLAEGIAGGFSAIYSELTMLETLGVARRGYFVESLGGAQFALPGAVERLRERMPDVEAPVVLAAVDPAQPYGAVLPWPARESGSPRGPARVPGAYVVLTGGAPVLYLERGGKAIQTLVPSHDPRLAPALRALVDYVRSGKAAVRRLPLEKVDGVAALTSPLGPLLVEVGFQEGPRRLTLGA
jgi:ATP-dependent Lhr-like helicase